MIFYGVIILSFLWTWSLTSCPKLFEEFNDQLCVHFPRKRKMNWNEADWFCKWNQANLIALIDEKTRNQLGTKRIF